MGGRLSTKQRLFVEYYLQCHGNGSEAARLAGYKKPGVSAWENLQKPYIRELIEDRLAAEGLTAAEVIRELAEIVRFDPGACLTENGQISLVAAQDTGATRMIKKLKQSAEGGIEIEAYDKLKALELIGKHLAMWLERTEHTGPGGGPMIYQFISNVDDSAI